MFYPLRYGRIEKNEVVNGYYYNECSYTTPDRFESTMPLSDDSFTCFNVNIKSTSKNLDKQKDCMSIANHEYILSLVSRKTF